MIFRRNLTGVLCAAGLWAGVAHAQGAPRENTDMVDARNAFAASIMAAHEHRLATQNIKETSRIGGYARMPDYFREVVYLDAADDKMLSRIRWIREQPDVAQMVELFIYDRQGRLSVDYYVSYLTEYRNAPIWALVNVHGYNGDLHAFRQFDTAYGDVIFERCEGQWNGQAVDLSLGDMDIAATVGDTPDGVAEDVYRACFADLPHTPAGYLDAAALVPGAKRSSNDTGGKAAQVERDVADLGAQIKATPQNGTLYVKRGQALFLLRRFDEAVRDFSQALDRDQGLDEAYFGRGMALGRMGELDAAIEDLSVYIDRNPTSARAYTKRGVRHIWNKDLFSAEADLARAIELDPTTAEAHDDLGVVLAQTGRVDQALALFLTARAIDPSYQKVHHNLGLVYYMAGDLQQATTSIEDALALDPDNRDSLLLKSAILEDMGKSEEAQELRERAEFLPQNNWSERTTVQ